MNPESSDPGTPGVLQQWGNVAISAMGVWGVGQVGASVGVEEHAFPLNLLLEPIKQNSFILCVGVMVDWEDSLNSSGFLQAWSWRKEAFLRSVLQLNCVCCLFPTKILSNTVSLNGWFSRACEQAQYTRGNKKWILLSLLAAKNMILQQWEESDPPTQFGRNEHLALTTANMWNLKPGFPSKDLWGPFLHYLDQTRN